MMVRGHTSVRFVRQGSKEAHCNAKIKREAGEKESVTNRRKFFDISGADGLFHKILR
jgi:hypothetical protein